MIMSQCIIFKFQPFAVLSSFGSMNFFFFLNKELGYESRNNHQIG